MGKLDDLNMTWDLEKIFPGGSSSQELQSFLSNLESELSDLGDEAATLTSDGDKIEDFVVKCQDTRDKLREGATFVRCLVSQDQQDKQAKALEGRVNQLQAEMEAIMIDLESVLQEFPTQEWGQIVDREQLKPVSFFLTELRNQGRDKLAPHEEKLATDLSVDGYHGWGELYHTIVGDITINRDGKKLSVGQAQNLLSSSEQSVRYEVGELIEQAFQEKEHLIANALNHLAGFRLNLYKHRGWDDYLKEPLQINRISKQTLNTMWETIEKHKHVFTDYYAKKKEMLGLDTFGWFDRNAPISGKSSYIDYSSGAKFIVEQFGKISDEMADFAEKALVNRWIEAENRGNKRPGGFCATFPVTGESRIFMTYSGSSRNVATLAHELGHAYHQWALRDQPSFASKYPMTLAETASTFAEQVISDAAIEASSDEQERLALLDEKISRSCAFFMDIHSRFLFESLFYQARAQGPVEVNKINELMVSSQKKAYQNSLDYWHPRFWATKLHFYLTRVPFYNFPYTFGYLFSMGIYSLFKQDPQNFPEVYWNLLKDTGRMTAEELALKHLNMDLRESDFWEQAVGYCIDDVNKFNTASQ